MNTAVAADDEPQRRPDPSITVSGPFVVDGLPSGLTTTVNTTGRAEPVLTVDQLAALRGDR